MRDWGGTEMIAIEVTLTFPYRLMRLQHGVIFLPARRSKQRLEMTNQFLLFAVCYAISPLAFLKPPLAPERTTRSTRASGSALPLNADGPAGNRVIEIEE